MIRNKIKIVYLIIAAAFVFAMPIPLWAENKEPLVLSLPQALEMAGKQHVDVIVANERVSQAIARIGENRSVLLPQLTGQVSQQRQTRNTQALGMSSPDPLVGPFNYFDARVQLTQTIFDPAAIKRLNSTHDSYDLSLAEFKKTQQDVLALVATFFLEAGRAQQNQKAAKAVFNYEKEKFKLANIKFKNGTGSLLEVKQAVVGRDKSFHDWRAAVAKSLDRRLDLAAALGIPFEQPIQFLEEEKLFKSELPTEEEIVEALTRQPAVEVARQDINKKKSQLAAERSGYLPKISALANYGPSGENPGDSSNTYLFGVQASVPIFEGGLRQSRVQEMASEVKQSEEVLKDTERHVEAKILNATQSIKEARAFIKQKKAEVGVARQSFDLAQNRLHSGSGSQLELSQSLAQKIVSEDGLKEAEAMYLLAQVNLAHALGKVDQLFKNETKESLSEK